MFLSTSAVLSQNISEIRSSASLTLIFSISQFSCLEQQCFTKSLEFACQSQHYELLLLQ